ncbi:DUF975 family protein [Acholeplasma granularum]|uniref:DUF975 family protein n=1 Tax=Acholeplasma granularum TaxID=264635 RepID=UPI0004724883|nr:DUF975 family protein [Acholeplasma granularum]
MLFKDIKLEAKNALVGNRLMFLLAILVAGVISSVIPGLQILIGPVVMAGLFFIGKKLLSDKKVDFELMFTFFKDLNHAIKLVAVQLLVMLIVLGGFLLLIIPGYIFLFRYSQALFIMSENKDMDIMDALKESRRMMKGYKWNYFFFSLSFIGHILLGIITFGIYLLYALPYINLSMYNYYLHLKVEHGIKDQKPNLLEE